MTRNISEYMGYIYSKRRAKVGTRKRSGAYEYMIAEQLGMCPYCNEPLKERYAMDHIVPMNNGGTDDDGNLTPCCESCNHKKNNLSLLVFLATRTENNVDKYWKRTGNWHNA